MNTNSKILGLAMACLMLSACGKANEEKVLSEAQSSADEFVINMPDCAKRDINTRKYLNGRGCTSAEREAYRKQRGW